VRGRNAASDVWDGVLAQSTCYRTCRFNAR